MPAGSTKSQAPLQREGRLPRGLMQRLLDSLRQKQGRRDLPPAGQRSGRGARSIEPYLEQTRNSRPAALE